MISLDILKTGQLGVVLDINGGDEFLSKVSSMGFTPNVEVAMVQNHKKAPLIVYLRDSEIIIDRNQAKRIDIRRKE
jgi:ferrous iron transport protein A